MTQQKLTFKTVFFIMDEDTQPQPAFVERLGAGPAGVNVYLPDDIPEGWIVFNAPRPLYGHWTWTGEFRSGIFYVAVDPAGEQATAFIKRNHENDARIVRWATLDKVRKEVIEFYQVNHPGLMDRLKEHYGEDGAEWPERDMVNTFVNQLDHDQEVVISRSTRAFANEE